MEDPGIDDSLITKLVLEKYGGKHFICLFVDAFLETASEVELSRAEYHFPTDLHVMK